MNMILKSVAHAFATTVTTVARNLSGPSGDPAIAQSFDQEAAAVSYASRFYVKELLIIILHRFLCQG